MKRLKISLLSVLILSGVSVIAQHNIDSLQQLLSTAKSDSTQANLLLAIGDAVQFQKNDLIQSKRYYALAGKLSEQINYPKGTLEYIFDYSDALVQQGLYDSALTMNLEASELAKKIKDSSRLVRANFNLGVCNSGLGQYATAIQYFQRAADYYQRKDQLDKVGMCFNELMILFRQTKNYLKAIKYGKNAVSLYKKYRPAKSLSIPLVNLSVVYQSMQQPQKAAPLLRSALAIDKKYHAEYGELNDLINLVDLEMHLNQTNHIESYCNRILELARKMEDNESICDGYLQLATYFLNKNQLTKAGHYADSAIQIAGTTAINELKQSCYHLLSHIAYATHNYQKALYYDEQTDLAQQTIITSNINKNVQELQTKYETVKKEARIKTLQNQQHIQQLSIHKKRAYIIIMTLIIIALLIIGLLYYRNYKRKQKLLITEKKLQQEQINALEQEKKLLATEAVMQGQEEERSRLAKDLHDGLGGILSGAKYSLNNMKENMIITPQNAAAFERTVEILDKSISELRRVAHNMMPESLVDQKLTDALRDFCSLITSSGGLNLVYHDVGMESIQLENSVKVTLYRIIQELINNIIKHALAKNGLIQIIAKNGQLSVTIEDDGVGFDTNILDKAKGIGYKNIFSRIDYLKGKMDIDSQIGAGKGTSIYIQIPI